MDRAGSSYSGPEYAAILTANVIKRIITLKALLFSRITYIS